MKKKKGHERGPNRNLFMIYSQFIPKHSNVSWVSRVYYPTPMWKARDEMLPIVDKAQLILRREL